MILINKEIKTMLNNRVMKLLNEDWKIFDSCYDNPNGIINNAKSKGYKEIKAYRTKSDTKGLKCFVVLVK